MIPAPVHTRPAGRIGSPPLAHAQGHIPIPPTAVTMNVGRQFSDSDLARLVDKAARHVADMLGGGYAVTLDVLGDIELPPGAEANIDRDQMRGLAALYFAAAVEPARIIASAETLAALAASGSIRLDLGDAAPLIRDFWRARNQRIDASERSSFFGRLFGSSYGTIPAETYANLEFDALMINLCETLYRLTELSADPVHGSVAQQSRLRATARDVIANLVNAGGSATAFLAEEILGVLKTAITLLSNQHLRGVFMARDIWGVIAGINRLAGRRRNDHRALVSRGKAGMTVIAWLADIVPHLGRHRGPLVRLDHPVIPAAVDWLQASLQISEREDARRPAPQVGPAERPESQWIDMVV